MLTSYRFWWIWYGWAQASCKSQPARRLHVEWVGVGSSPDVLHRMLRHCTTLRAGSQYMTAAQHVNPLYIVFCLLILRNTTPRPQNQRIWRETSNDPISRKSFLQFPKPGKRAIAEHPLQCKGALVDPFSPLAQLESAAARLRTSWCVMAQDWLRQPEKKSKH